MVALTVLVTIPEEKADDFAKLLLSSRLCACINVVPGVRSHYWWENKITTAGEALLVIKTKPVLIRRLKEAIKDNHPYSVPEILVINVDDIGKDYQKWLNQEASGQC